MDKPTVELSDHTKATIEAICTQLFLETFRAVAFQFNEVMRLQNFAATGAFIRWTENPPTKEEMQQMLAGLTTPKEPAP